VELVDLINNIDFLIVDKRPAHEIREQLRILRDQVEVLESRLRNLEGEVNPLAQECEGLRAQLGRAQREITDLKQLS
jgi:predicted RNase H-like nuclease (RuvC/YqgF family)